MKVLFAVSNEEISESIVKRYQKDYKQIISYKNVYYFNAILKEIQKDKTYDRIVISEDLEAFTHTQYDQIDKFIFDKLDSISDEASNVKGNDIPIILICSDRRTKSEPILVKLFGIGIYNAIIGNDRSIEEVCKLINRPRVKKEAKIYYKIDSEDVNYQPENENDVSEMEIQNIVAYYKKLGKNEDKYVESFEKNIAEQYNDTQLRIISKFLPLNVRAVLEEKSPKYQQIMSFNNSVSNSLRYKKKEEKGTSETLLKMKNKPNVMSKPVVIPSSVDLNSTKKLAKVKRPHQLEKEEIEQEERPVVQNLEINNAQRSQITQNIQNDRLEMQKNQNNVNNTEINDISNAEEPPKRRRGRPRKNPEVTEQVGQTVKRGRGRPRKNQEIEETENNILPGFEEETSEEPSNNNYQYDYEQRDNDAIEDVREPENYDYVNKYKINNYSNQQDTNNYSSTYREDVKTYEDEEEVDLSRLLTSDRKIVTFIGTSKNGTSFIVNNIAKLMSDNGINTAILDTTRNRNSYYIYTKNEDELRNIAVSSIRNLENGMADGIPVNKNLTVYTSLPGENDNINNAGKILETLLKNHSLILIDTDFSTSPSYFKYSQETYLVQSLDILTIQPLTAYLRELKAKNVLDESKLRIILNKSVKLRGINEKTIIGGMAYYNDPAMSYMIELFDKNVIKYISIPFDEEVYIKYLEGIINCDINLKVYSKSFMQILNSLGNMVYPVVAGAKSSYRPPNLDNNGFSPSINNTLDQMKKRY